MPTTEKSMVIHAPIDRVYNVWMNFEDFPIIMDHVAEITLRNPVVSHWKVELSGMTFEFDAEITELKENKHIAWKSRTGIKHTGTVDFAEVPEGTKLTIHLDYMPQTIPQELAGKLGAINTVESQIDGDLNALKAKIEKMAHAA